VRGHLLLTAAMAGVSQALVAAQQPEARFTARSDLVVLHASVTKKKNASDNWIVCLHQIKEGAKKEVKE
jgi:hypothetical protein